jgi:hypothetical protein
MSGLKQEVPVVAPDPRVASGSLALGGAGWPPQSADSHLWLAGPGCPQLDRFL